MRKHVRVSEILARLFPYEGVDQEVLEAKAAIGTNVHDAIKQDCAGEFVVLQSDRAQAYFESYKMSTFAGGPITSIPRLYCDKLMITGECDGVYPSKSGYHLIDWKCSYEAKLEMWNMQAHFYWYLMNANGKMPLDTMFWVNLRHEKAFDMIFCPRLNREKKVYRLKDNGDYIYLPLEPVVYEFKYDEKILSRCIDEANRYWEEKQDAKVLV